MKLFLFLLVASTALISSCSNYNKVVKSDDYERKFELANELYDRKQWLRSVALYEQVFQRVPKTAQGEISYFRMGKAYFEEGDYYMGGYYLATFSEKYPASPKTEESLFLSSLCAVNNSPTSSLDQNETELALNDLQMFINRFPNSPLVDTCNIIMDKLLFKLETKDFDAVKLYNKTENFKAAVTSAEVFLSKYPRSIFREDASFIAVKNSYLLTKNSIDNKKLERIDQTIERYRTFANEFPESKRLKELESNVQELEKEKNTNINTKK